MKRQHQVRRSGNRKIASTATEKAIVAEKILTVVKVIDKNYLMEKIPTSLVPLSPEKIMAENQIDVLVGLFHIMWEDMPMPRTYSIRLADLVSFEGEYIGSSLKNGASGSQTIKL